MELGLSLGPSRPREASKQSWLGFNTTSLSVGSVITKERYQHQEHEQITEKKKHRHNYNSDSTTEEATNESLSHSLKGNNNAVLQLDLLPYPPPHLSFPWHPPLQKANKEEDEADEEAAPSSSPNSIASTFQMDLCMFSRRSVSTGRASDEDENGGGRTRKKLRLSKEQSWFLEESYKEHNTLNQKQKIVLAKQLHLRPRQVEVWFQNRRARTKLKQIEMECEYLKRSRDTLTEENRRLHKELQELKALKTSNQFHMQLPATTLTMCPSCERVATNSISTTGAMEATTTAKTIEKLADSRNSYLI